MITALCQQIWNNMWPDWKILLNKPTPESGDVRKMNNNGMISQFLHIRVLHKIFQEARRLKEE